MKKITILIPVYNEQANLENNISTIWNCISGLKYQFRILLINDGSSDETWNVVEKLCSKNDYIYGISLSRNFGKEHALICGMDHAEGDAVIVMDSDLQHPPNLIPSLISPWENDGCETVNAVKCRRAKESIWEKLSAKIFYKLLFLIGRMKLENSSDFKLISRKVIEELRDMNESNLFFRGMTAWLGFKTAEIKFIVENNQSQREKMSLKKRFMLAFTAITSFSSSPLQLISLASVLFFLISGVIFLHSLYMKFWGGGLEGFATVNFLILFSGALNMLGLGILGYYMGLVYSEVKRRPRYVVRKRLGFAERDVVQLKKAHNE